MQIHSRLLREIKPQRDAKLALTICKSLNLKRFCPRLHRSWLMGQLNCRDLSGRTTLASSLWRILRVNHSLPLIWKCNFKLTNALTSNSWHFTSLKVLERSLTVFWVSHHIRTQLSKSFITSGLSRTMELSTTLWSVFQLHPKIWARHHMLCSEDITLHRLLEEQVDSRLSKIMRIG